MERFGYGQARHCASAWSSPSITEHLQGHERSSVFSSVAAGDVVKCRQRQGRVATGSRGVRARSWPTVAAEAHGAKGMACDRVHRADGKLGRAPSSSSSATRPMRCASRQPCDRAPTRATCMLFAADKPTAWRDAVLSAAAPTTSAEALRPHRPRGPWACTWVVDAPLFKPTGDAEAEDEVRCTTLDHPSTHAFTSPMPDVDQ